MKKFTLVFAGLLFSSLLSSAQVRYGLTAGVQPSNEKYSFGGLSVTTKNYVGYMAGLVADAMLTENLSIRPQLLYSVKGSTLDLGSLSAGTASGSINTVFNYIEVPVQLTYSLDAGPGSVVIGAGPYVAYGLSAKTSATDSGQKISEKIDFGSNDGEYKRLDYGLRLSVGYELPSGLMLHGYYSPGLANILNGPMASVKNTAFGLSLGILFGEK